MQLYSEYGRTTSISAFRASTATQINKQTLNSFNDQVHVCRSSAQHLTFSVLLAHFLVVLHTPTLKMSPAEPTPFNMLTGPTVQTSRLVARVFGPSLTEHAGATRSHQRWTKWSATLIDAQGNTVTITKTFSGEAGAQQPKAHFDKFKDGIVVDINPKGTKTKGLKSMVKKPEYDSSTSAVTVAFTDKTEVVLKTDDVANLPMRPKISLPLSKLAQINSDRRVNVCGIVLSVSEAADREVTSIKTKEADMKQVADIKFTDDSGFTASLAAWEDAADEVQTLTGNFVALYNIKLKVGFKDGEVQRTVQTTADTIIKTVSVPDGISKREDTIISKSAALMNTESSNSATTTFEASGNSNAKPLQDLRLICVKSLSLSQEIIAQIDEEAFQLEGVLVDIVDPENAVSQNGRLWTKLTLTDATGQCDVYAAEQALLELSSMATKEAFLEALADNALHLPRAVIQVVRRLKYLTARTTTARQVVSAIITHACPQFVPKPVQNPNIKYEDTDKYGDSSGVTASRMQDLTPNTAGPGFDIQSGEKTYESSGGAFVLLRTTTKQIPKQNGEAVMLLFKDMEDATSPEDKTKYNIMAVMPLARMLQCHAPPGRLVMFRLTHTTVINDTDTAFTASHVFNTDADIDYQAVTDAFVKEIEARYR